MIVVVSRCRGFGLDLGWVVMRRRLCLLFLVHLRCYGGVKERDQNRR